MDLDFLLKLIPVIILIIKFGLELYDRYRKTKKQ